MQPKVDNGKHRRRSLKIAKDESVESLSIKIITVYFNFMKI